VTTNNTSTGDSTGEAEPPSFASPQIDPTVAHPARVYDFWLGGKDHFIPDREAGQAVIETNPAILPGVRSNRAFLVRAVRYLVRDAGIGQILDIGTGLPSANNVHEVAQAIAPETRVVYVDNDPIVLVHAHALLTGTPGTVDYIDADLRRPGSILQRAEKTLDFSQPIALMVLMTMQFIADGEDPHGIVRSLVDALPSGSYLVLSHPARDDEVGIANAATSRYNEKVATPMTRRTREEIARFFDGLEMLDPGLVAPADWRPGPGSPPASACSPAFCAVARKP
jgi:SAM-dependent methyltransferase